MKWETLGDLAGKDWNLGVRCECGHRGIVDARQTSRWFACHRWDTRKSALPAHLWCSRCRRRGRITGMGVSAETPRDLGRFPRNEDGWRALVKRLRG